MRVIMGLLYNRKTCSAEIGIYYGEIRLNEDKLLPQWAPRISKSKIKRLYELDARGIYDDELLDEVGYALRSRCQSFISACQAAAGMVSCPVCETQIPHDWDKEKMLICPDCNWQLSWGDYFATIQHKQLSGAEPVLELFRTFVDRFPQAKTDQKKMFYIDRLLHGFHWSVKYGPTRPVAINLIEGRLGDVILFLDRLSDGPGSTPGLAQRKAEWIERSQNARNWALKKPEME